LFYEPEQISDYEGNTSTQTG